jgi:hypothetical protein
MTHLERFLIPVSHEDAFVKMKAVPLLVNGIPGRVLPSLLPSCRSLMCARLAWQGMNNVLTCG